jgi:hypothetical protein
VTDRQTRVAGGFSDYSFLDLPSLPWPRSLRSLPWPRPWPSSVRDSCLPGWSGQALPSHWTIVVVFGGVVVVDVVVRGDVVVDVVLGATAVGARSGVAVVGSVGPLVAARAGSSSVWRRSSPPVNPIRNTKVQTAAAWPTGIRWGGAVILTALSPPWFAPLTRTSVLVEQQPNSVSRFSSPRAA